MVNLLYRSTRAAVTKYHKLFGLNNRNLLSQSSEARNPRSRCQLCWLLLRAEQHMVSMTVCELELPIGTSLECKRPGSTRVQGTQPCERGSFLFFKVVLFFHQQPLIRKKRKEKKKECFYPPTKKRHGRNFTCGNLL